MLLSINPDVFIQSKISHPNTNTLDDIIMVVLNTVFIHDIGGRKHI